MCGIAGYITRKKFSNYSYKETKNKLRKLMFRRGPNQQGSLNYNTNNFSINLFSSRLSIIDLDKRADQPFKSEDSVLIFNGEIYNFLEIKEFLKTKKIKFITNSDTEVLLKAYQFWGEKCVDHFDGMWAFCIFNKRKNYIFISRDNFGEKPLIYYHDYNNFVFGSEIKYIKNILGDDYNPELNQKKVNDYLFKGYKSLNKNNETYFKNIYKLEPGSNLIFNLKNFKLYKKKYLDRNLIASKKISKDLHENIYDVKNLLEESLKLRLRADVPISFCLSGGVDSSSLVSLCYKKFNIKPKCYSIVDTDKRYNEKDKTDILKRDINCNIKYINLKKEKEDIFFENLKKLIDYREYPISTISYYIHSKISSSSKMDGNKVIFSGTGADEIFTGYYDHFLLFLNEIKHLKNFDTELGNWKKFIKPFVRNTHLKNENLFYEKPKFRDHIYHDKRFIKKFMKSTNEINFSEKNYVSNKLKNRMLNELFHESVPVILEEDDSNSMYNSIENRSPFLSKKLVNYCLSINKSNYIKNGYSKNILRSSMKGILNDNIRLNRRKIGFNSNLKSISNINYNFLHSFLRENEVIKNIINLNELRKIDFRNGLSNTESKFIFSLINMKIFLDLNF